VHERWIELLKGLMANPTHLQTSGNIGYLTDLQDNQTHCLPI